MFYFYIVRCFDNSLYCGQTNNLERRIKEHNFDKNRSAKYMRGKTPVKLIYYEKYPTLQLAMKRELQVKKWTRAKKEALANLDEALELYFEDVQNPKITKIENPEIVRFSLPHA